MNTRLPGIKESQSSSELIASNILLLEGKDEELLIGKMLKHLNIAGVQCIDIEGKEYFPPTIRSLRDRPRFEKVQKIGFVADAEQQKASSTFDSLKYHLGKANFTIPKELLTLSDGSPQIGIFVMPNNQDAGMLEDLCLQSVPEDSLRCVDDFMHCAGIEPTEKPQKRRTLAYLSITMPLVHQVGLAAEKRIWNFDHHCFDQLKAFLEQFR